jgi:putative oxidoreductase
MSKISTARNQAISANTDVDSVAQATPTTWQRIVAFLTGPYPTLVSRFVLGGIMFLAGLTKLGVPTTMKQSILAYEINLPPAVVDITATALPILEVGIGVWLIIGLFIRFSAVVSMVLMAIFTIAITQAWLRGLQIDCGCFGGAQGNSIGLGILKALGPIGDYLGHETAGPATIIRDVVLFLMGLHVFLVPSIYSIDNLRTRNRMVEEE